MVGYIECVKLHIVLRQLKSLRTPGVDQKLPNCGARPPRGRFWSSGGARVICVRYILVLNVILAQDKICILADTLLG
jgi:hypothetical protein